MPQRDCHTPFTNGARRRSYELAALRTVGVRDGSLRAAGGLGMLWYAKQSYKDFSVKLQFRDIAPEGFRANSGVFVRFPDPRTPLAQRPPGSCGTVGSARTSQAWVAIYCGHEIQIYDGTTGEPQKTGSVYNFDSRTLDQAGLVTSRPAVRDAIEESMSVGEREDWQARAVVVTLSGEGALLHCGGTPVAVPAPRVRPDTRRRSNSSRPALLNSEK